MRIAFMVWKDVRHGDGPLRKIAQQIRWWTASGHQVRLFVLGPADRIWQGADDLSSALYRYGHPGSRLRQARRLVGDVIAWQPDLAFFRLSAYYPPFGRLLKRIPTVLDLNSNDLRENQKVLTPLPFLYYRLTREILLKGARGFTPVTHELAQLYARYDKPTRVVSNGIDLSQYAPLPPADNARPRIFFIGSTFQSRVQPWHGIDKLLRLARAVPEWDFEVVGPAENELPSPPPANLEAHGFLPRDEYEKILARADVAIGSLAMHRIAINEGSPLKVREYLAFGVPAVVGFRDADFLEPPDFLLQLPNTPDNVEQSLSRLRAFVARWKGRRLDRREISHLDMRVKEELRLSFFQSLVEGC